MRHVYLKGLGLGIKVSDRTAYFDHGAVSNFFRTEVNLRSRLFGDDPRDIHGEYQVIKKQNKNYLGLCLFREGPQVDQVHVLVQRDVSDRVTAFLQGHEEIHAIYGMIKPKEAVDEIVRGLVVRRDLPLQKLSEEDKADIGGIFSALRNCPGDLSDLSSDLHWRAIKVRRICFEVFRNQTNLPHQ